MAGNSVSGAISSTTTLPLISFHAIIDEDMAVLKHVILEYKNDDVFDLGKLKSMTYAQILGDLYRRKYKNPLYFIMKDDKYKDFLDECYNEFINEHEADILKHYVATEMYNVVDSFSTSGDIIPTLLYYTDAQRDLLDSLDEMKDINKVSFKEAIANPKYSHFYFKYISELEPFLNDKMVERVFYLSTAGLNLNETNSDITIDNDKLVELSKNRVQISLFDIYRTDIIGDYPNDNT